MNSLMKLAIYQLITTAMTSIVVSDSLNEETKLVQKSEKVLFDFSSAENLDNWLEISDTVREVGKSKATLVLQKTQIFQRAIFFSLLNPQINGACFAGMTTSVQWNLGDFNILKIRLKAQGNSSHFKIVLRHKGLNTEPNPEYEYSFMAPKDDFDVITIPLESFEPYYRGRKMNVSEVGILDKRNITRFGFQSFGGVYLPYKQSGPSTLEIDWVCAD